MPLTLVLVLALLACATPLRAQTLTDTSVSLPTASELRSLLTLQDYNTRIVILGTAALGTAAGMIGTFMLLRKRALLGDALSHATLPGIAIAFILMTLAGGTGKSLPGLLIGATVTGLLGVAAILVIRGMTRIKEDAALGIVLSVFFGLGVALLGIIQNMDRGSAAGLETFIYGKTASMLRGDAQLIGITAILVAIICALLFKEFTLLCFDQTYARTQGWPALGLDLTLMAFVTAVTVIGLQAVGLILIIALLIIPPAAARFWTERLSTMLIVAAVLGALSGVLGAAASALQPRMPAGAIIVVAASVLFVVSMFFGTSRGVLRGWLRQRRLVRRVGQQHLLRAILELIEHRTPTGAAMTKQPVSFDEIAARRAWWPGELNRLLRRAAHDELLVHLPDGTVQLTDVGWSEAQRIVRNHRLWEMYLITHADVAPSHVDRDADMIEHVLGTAMVLKLEGLLRDRDAVAMPESPHVVNTG